MQTLLAGGIALAGLAITTSNSRELRENTAEIPRLWERFFQEGIERQIPAAKSNDPIFAVYYNYRTDESGSFDVLIGKEYDKRLFLADLSTYEIPRGNYIVFDAASTDPQSIRETWMQIWEHFSTAQEYERTFIADYEMYSTDGDAITHAQIFVGVEAREAEGEELA